MINEHRIMIERAFVHSFGFNLIYGIRNAAGNYSIAKPLVFENLAPGHMAAPCMQFDESVAQQLIDQLWIAGARPSVSLRDPANAEHLEGEIGWLRGLVDHQLKRK